ncbi:MAG: hypothetical protein KBD53_07130 [Candidatus Omnitrophica bacterium]|nr:hypothetical protein [Candidatus Omnitrophota bacterium]
MRIYKRYAAIITLIIISSQMGAWAKNSSTLATPQPYSVQATPQEIDKVFLALFLKKHNIESLDQYIVWLQKNVHYQPDGNSDQWSNPIQTILRRNGDCEDLAFLNYAVLNAFGIDSKVLGIKKDSAHHLFTVFQYKQRMFVFDNTDCIQTKAQTFEDITVFLYDKYHIDYLLEATLYPKSASLLLPKERIQEMVQLSRHKRDNVM